MGIIIGWLEIDALLGLLIGQGVWSAFIRRRISIIARELSTVGVLEFRCVLVFED
jgi:hypothetical protein